MHKMQICHVYDMSIENDMCEHNQQIWRCWCTNVQCRGMSGGSKVHPISPSAPQLEGPMSQSPMSLSVREMYHVDNKKETTMKE